MTTKGWSAIFLLSAALWASVATAEKAFFEADGVKIHYTDEGRGVPVLLIHGFTGDIERTWRQRGVIEGLVRAGYRVIAYDNRAHGESDKPREPEKYGLEMVEDGRRMLDHLEIEQAHIVGYSMGSRIAIKFREVHPRRFLTVTLGGFGWPLPPRERSVEELETTLRTRGLLDVMDPVALAVVRSRFTELAVDERSLRANKVPALVLVGDEDFLYPAAQSLAETISNVEMKVVPGTHGTALASEEFINGLLDFLGRHDPQPKTN